MKTTFNNELHKKYIEVLPSLSIGWYMETVIHFQWLVWSITIEIK